MLRNLKYLINSSEFSLIKKLTQCNLLSSKLIDNNYPHQIQSLRFLFNDLKSGQSSKGGGGGGGSSGGSESGKKVVVGYAVPDSVTGRKKVRTVDIVNMKQKGKRIKCLTCYDYTFASILDRTNVDIVLVGDSAGHVMQGKSNTLSVTLDHIKYHVECVAPALRRPLLVADLPFMTVGPSLEKTCANVAVLMSAGAECVKIEGATPRVLQQIEFLVSSGVPVMGHIGLQPQAVHAYGGFKIQGKNDKGSSLLMKQAKDLEMAGCFSMVVELTEPNVATALTKSINIPTISIGAGNECDGNILVIQDMLGMNIGFKPKFLKTFANLEEEIRTAVNSYCEAVDNGTSEPI